MAGGYGIAWDRECATVHGPSLREHDRATLSPILSCALMGHAIEEGHAMFDLERCAHGRGGVDATPWGRPRMFRVGDAQWRKLPIGVAAPFGPMFGRVPS